MSDKKKQTDLTEAQLDRLMASYEAPTLDGEAFNQKLMSRIGKDSPAPEAEPRVMIWSWQRRLAGFAVIALLISAFIFGQPLLDSGMPSPETTQMAAVSTSDQNDQNDLAEMDAFLNEIIDQDIAVLEYSVAMNTTNNNRTAPENQNRQNGEADLPPIDEFLDELLGLESRTL